NHKLDSEFQGIIPLEFSFHGRFGDFRNPEILRKLDEATQLVQGGGGKGVTSLSAVVKDLNQKVTGSLAVPGSTEAISQLLLLVEGTEAGLERLVDDEFSHARVFATSPDLGARDFIPMVDEWEAQFETLFKGTGIKGRVTGVIPVASKVMASLIQQLLNSLMVALLVIIVSLGFVFRSIKMALAGLLSNVLPLLLTLGFYGINEFELDPGTAVIFTIALGIAVDDTIHLLARYREELRGTTDIREAIITSVTHSAGAIVLTSVILSAGFLVISLSTFPANRTFGLLGSAIIFLALIADLIFTPAALLWLKPTYHDGKA
ncbi:MAG: MMPL family transporter, partial [Myxococcota bacterium]|nr:MMPL family transporter [Myxococcota bacterium]